MTSSSKRRHLLRRPSRQRRWRGRRHLPFIVLTTLVVIIAVGPGCAMPTNEPEPPTLSQHAQLSDGSSRFISKYLGDDALGMLTSPKTSPARIRA